MAGGYRATYRARKNFEPLRKVEILGTEESLSGLLPRHHDDRMLTNQEAISKHAKGRPERRKTYLKKVKLENGSRGMKPPV